MKVLFGVFQNNDKTFENKVLNKYIENGGEEFQYNSEFYLQGIKEELKNSYDFLIVNEELEKDNPITIQYLDEVTDKYPELKIILLANEHKNDMFLKQVFNLGIYNVLYIENADVNNIVELLFRSRTKAEAKSYIDLEIDDIVHVDSKGCIIDEVIEKIVEKEKIVEVEKEVVKEVIKSVVVEKTVQKTIKQNVLTFYTTDNSLDKDDVLTQIAILLAKKSDQKILVVDMNTLTPGLDHFFNVDKEIAIKDIYNSISINTGLSAVCNAIDKKIFDACLLKQLTIHHSKYDNLEILTGLYDVNLFETAQIKHFQELIDKAKEVYDTIIINTHPCISIDATYVALKKASKIIGVSNANYTNARNMNFIFNYLVEHQDIAREKIEIVINNLSDYSLSKDTMKEIFKNYDILGYINSNPKRETYLNCRKSFISSNAAKKDINAYIDIIEKLGYIPKTSALYKLFNKKKIAEQIIEKEVEEVACHQ